MFDYLLSIGADIYKRNNYGKDIYDHIKKIQYETIRKTLLLKVSNHIKTSIYLLIN